MEEKEDKDYKRAFFNEHQKTVYYKKQFQELKGKYILVENRADDLEKENKKLSKELLTFKNDFQICKDIVNTLIEKSVKAVGKDFGELAQRKDIARTNFKTILFDLEAVFLFQKLFEMHTFDYIVDRQNVDDFTAQQNTNLICECKSFTNALLFNLTLTPALNIRKFKSCFKGFVKEFVTDDEE